jgi:hypothetical protein
MYKLFYIEVAERPVLLRAEAEIALHAALPQS